MREPIYYRARMDVLEKFSGLNDANVGFYRNGVVPPDEREEFEKHIQDAIERRDDDNDPLIFKEITRYNTWFAMHPEKICGVEKLTTSREFPVTIKGKMEDVIETIGKGLSQSGPEVNKKLALARAKAKALMMLTISGLSGVGSQLTFKKIKTLVIK